MRVSIYYSDLRFPELCFRARILGNPTLLSVLSCVRSERGNASFNLFGSSRFDTDCIAVHCGCNVGAGSPAIVTSQRSGLPEPQYHNATRTLMNTPAPPKPDMTSQAVALSHSALDATAKIGSAALAARAKAQHKDKRVTGYQQTRLFDRFSIKGN